MARFLFCVCAAAGHMGPTLPVAIELRRRGHDVAILTNKSYRQKIEALGLVHLGPRAWHGNLGVPDREPARTKIGMTLRNRENVAKVFLPSARDQARDLRDVMREWPADVIVGNEGAPGVALIGEKDDRPWATHGVLIQCLLPSRDLPTWGMNSAPPRTPWARRKTRLVNSLARRLSQPIFDLWNQIRGEVGLPHRDASTLHELLFSPHLYTVPSSPDFDYPRSDLPPHVHYVGPCLPVMSKDDGTWESPFDSGRPLVYGTAGTVSNHPRFHRLLVEAARGEPYDLFLTLGHEHDPAILEPLPPNVRAARFVPQSLLLPLSSLMVSNGSDGSVMGALVCGKPVVVLPHAGSQPETSRRCAESGIGLIAGLGTCSPRQMRRAIREAIENPAYGESARRIGARLARMDGPSNTADRLEALAYGRSAST